MGNDTGQGPLRGGCEGWVGLDWPRKERWERPQPWVSANLDLPRAALVCHYTFLNTEPRCYLEIPRGVCLHWNALPWPSCLLRGNASLPRLGITDNWLLGHSRECLSCAPALSPRSSQTTLEGSVTLNCKIKWMHLWIRYFRALDQSLACWGSGPLSEWV